MSLLASHFGSVNSIRRECPLTIEELLSEKSTILAVTVILTFPPSPC